MTQRSRQWPPTVLLSFAVVFCVLMAGWATWIALQQPWLGWRTAVDVEADAIHVLAVDQNGPARAIPVPARLISIQGTNIQGYGGAIVVKASDLVEEPDTFERTSDYVEFLARQSSLADALQRDTIQILVEDPTGTRHVLSVQPEKSRPFFDLPFVFWVQLIVGTGGVLIGAWVWVLRRRDWGPRMFAFAGASMMLSAFTAAVYSTRELAIDGGLFRILSALNHTGAFLFGVAMIALFLCYPRQLVRPRVLLIIPAIFVPWLIFDISLKSPDMGLSHRLPISLEMFLIVVAILVQWWMNRGDPIARAALRWLGLSVTLGAGAFVLLVISPALIGLSPVLNQGYAFIFFLLIYIGMALGLRRYRLFELDEWAFRILFYTGGILGLIALDAVLIFALRIAPEWALGLSLLLIGFLYLPLRDWIWRRTVARRKMEDHELFRSVIAVAFSGQPGARAGLWRDLVQRLFDPLELTPVTVAGAEATIRSDGLELVMPATADSPALAARYPWQGRGLYSSVHLQLARQLTDLMTHADQSRNAYERGVSTERQRIARDLHDDVGSRLLSGLHKPDISQTRRTLRDAVADIRTIVSGLSGNLLPLGQVIADLRHESGERLDAAGVALTWPLSSGDDDTVMLEYSLYKNLSSSVREIVSNIIRHAGAQTVAVNAEYENGTLSVTIADDGVGLQQSASSFTKESPLGSGNGLRNIGKRITEIGGTLSFMPVDKGTCISLVLPIEVRTGPKV